MNEKVFKSLVDSKISKIKKHEKEYWRQMDNKRTTLSESPSALAEKLDIHFPPNHSSIIIACQDGAIIMRYINVNISGQTQIYYDNRKLTDVAKQGPCPDKNGTIFQGTVGAYGIGCSLSISNSYFGGVEIERAEINSFLYEDLNSLDLESAIEDFHLFILANNINFNFDKNSSIKSQEQNIIQNYLSILADFENILNNSSKEEDIQKFLNNNTFLINPYSERIIKQKLGENFVTDYVLMTILDQGPIYYLVEIEKSSMPIFTKQLEFTSEFKHAENQILSWDEWLEDNKDYLQRKLKGFESPKYLIIAGRSKDLGEDAKKRIRTWNRNHWNTTFLTYDDLITQAKTQISNLKSCLK